MLNRFGFSSTISQTSFETQEEHEQFLQNLLMRNNYGENGSISSTSIPASIPSQLRIPRTTELSRVPSNSSISSAFRDGQFDLLRNADGHSPNKHSPNKQNGNRNMHSAKSPLAYALQQEELLQQQRTLELKSNSERNNRYSQNNKPQDIDILLRIFGEPYSNKIWFWTQILPSAAILGLLVGVGCFLFLSLYKLIFFFWAYDEFKQDITDDSDAKKVILLVKGKWWWLIVTTIGQFLAGIVLLFPKAPKLGEAKTFFHDAVTLQGNVQQTPYVILSSFFSLCSGASIGPEMVLGAYGTGLATYLSQTQRYIHQQGDYQLSQNKCIHIFLKCIMFPLKIFHSQPRVQMSLVLCGMGAALGSVFPSPVLAVLIVLELSIAARPHDLRLDAAVKSAERNGNGNRMQTNGNNNQYDMDEESRSEKGHDYMEQMTIVGVATTFAFIAFQGFKSALVTKQQSLSSPEEDRNGLMSYQNHNEEKINMWHILMAVPLGMLCGALGAFYLLLNGIFRKIRARIRVRCESMGCPDAMALLLIPTLCGLFHGLITVAFPLTLGSGTLILSDLVTVGMNLDTNQYHDISPPRFFVSGVMKLVSSALCLGFGGLVGGQLFPLVFAGACIGISIPHYLPMFPAHLTIPCCMASVTGSFVPIPLTVSSFAMMRMGNDVELGAAVLVSVVVAYSCNGGLGLVQKGKNKLGLGEEERNQRDGYLDLNQYLKMDYDETETMMDSNSVSMVRDVSSIIFT